MQLAATIVQHKTELEAFRKRISEGRVEYTPMKIVDMCFWQTEFDADTNRNGEEYDTDSAAL